MSAMESDGSFVMSAPMNDTRSSRTEGCSSDQQMEILAKDSTESSLIQVNIGADIDDSVIRIDEETFLHSKWESPKALPHD